jgi:hypothetical protein
MLHREPIPSLRRKNTASITTAGTAAPGAPLLYISDLLPASPLPVGQGHVAGIGGQVQGNQHGHQHNDAGACRYLHPGREERSVGPLSQVGRTLYSLSAVRSSLTARHVAINT